MEIYWVSCKIDTRNTRHMFKKIKEGKIELVSDCKFMVIESLDFLCLIILNQFIV